MDVQISVKTDGSLPSPERMVASDASHLVSARCMFTEIPEAAGPPPESGTEEPSLSLSLGSCPIGIGVRRGPYVAWPLAAHNGGCPTSTRIQQYSTGKPEMEEKYQALGGKSPSGENRGTDMPPQAGWARWLTHGRRRAVRVVSRSFVRGSRQSPPWETRQDPHGSPALGDSATCYIRVVVTSRRCPNPRLTTTEAPSRGQVTRSGVNESGIEKWARLCLHGGHIWAFRSPFLL